MKKTFYVCDSYHTGAIAEEIKKAFPGSIVYTDSTFFSVAKDLPAMTAVNILQKTITEKDFVKDEVGTKVDFFILSAKLISDGSIDPKELKKMYGNMESKTIAVSVLFRFLEQVKSLVDFTQDKETVMNTELLRKFFSKIA